MQTQPRLPYGGAPSTDSFDSGAKDSTTALGAADSMSSFYAEVCTILNPTSPRCIRYSYAFATLLWSSGIAVRHAQSGRLCSHGGPWRS